MQCPAQDGELVEKTVTNSEGLEIHVARCTACHGWWLDSFSANYLNSQALEEDSSLLGHIVPDHSVCPVCHKVLRSVQEESMPQGIFALTCEGGHGYFFPSGELSKFKRAQHAKLEYHKLWGIPLPNVKSILLASLTLVVLSFGLVLSLREVGRVQKYQSSAQQLITTQSAIVSPEARSVVIAVSTSEPSSVVIHVDKLKLERPMKTNDQLIHTIAIQVIPTDTYLYYFTVEKNNETVRSPDYSFTMP